MSYHFWYSPSGEEHEYQGFVMALEMGYLSAWQIPRWNTCLVSVCGEILERHYNICSDNPNAYEYVADKVYLGVGDFGTLSQMKLPQIVSRMRELGMIIPSVLTRSA